MRNKIYQEARRIIRDRGIDCLSVRAICARLRMRPGSFIHKYKGTFGSLVTRLIEEGNIGDLETTASRGRMCPRLRKRKVLICAVTRAKVDGYRAIDLKLLAATCGISRGSILHYFSSAAKLQDAVMSHAIENEVFEIVAQGLTLSDPAALHAPEALKVKTVKFMGSL